MWLLYQAAMALALALAAPYLLVRRGRHYGPTFSGRMGRWQPPEEPPEDFAPGGLWIHAVSVGEVGVAATLGRGLPEEAPAALVTTVTPTGQERARAAFPKARTAYLPFDLGPAVERFFHRHQPGALVLIEGDYWPLVLRAARRRRLPVAVVNGRVGERSFRRMLRLKRLLGPLFEPVTRFGVQTEEDRQRLLALGVPEEKVRVTGNLKYDTPAPQLDPGLEQAFATRADGRALLLAGSTMEGEDAQVAEAFEAAGGGERALLVIAPRHPERWDDVARLLAERGLRVERRSRFTQEHGSGRPDVVLLDSLGELAGLYRLATAAFIGGTLVPTGGHNPLEAAVFGVPVSVGPSMHNFRDMAERFDREQAWRRARDAGELGRHWRETLEQPETARAFGERGRALVEANQGATANTLEMLAPLFESLGEGKR